MKELLMLKAPGHEKSFTTAVFNRVCSMIGLDAHMKTMACDEAQFPEVMKRLRAGEFFGALVASPNKTPGMAFVDKMSRTVEKSEAMNLVVAREGQLFAHNTNGHGALLAIRKRIPILEGVSILVMGAGGAARAVSYKLALHGAKVTIWNRTPEKAQRCAENLGLEWVENLRDWNGKPKVIVNATTVSEQDSQMSLVPYALWEGVELAVEAAMEGMSLFLEEAQMAGVKNLILGDEWYAHQIMEIFDRFFGIPLDFDRVRSVIHQSKPE